MSGGSQTERKPLAEMIVLINWFAMIVLLVKRGGGEIWQSISGKPNVQTNFFWKPLVVIIHRQKSLDEPSSLQLSNLSMSKITSSPRFRNLWTNWHFFFDLGPWTLCFF